MPPYPHFRALYAVPVRQVRGLLTASFRFRLTADTLAVRLCASLLPTRTWDFHPLENAHAGQTKVPHQDSLMQGFFLAWLVFLSFLFYIIPYLSKEAFAAIPFLMASATIFSPAAFSMTLTTTSSSISFGMTRTPSKSPNIAPP